MEMMLTFGLLVYAIIIGVFVIWLWALIDIITSKFQDNMMQVIWLLVVFFLPFVGVILYLLIGRSMKGSVNISPDAIDHRYEHLAKIKELLDNGILSQEEFDTEKEKILNRNL
jgi:hypothetical protein